MTLAEARSPAVPMTTVRSSFGLLPDKSLGKGVGAALPAAPTGSEGWSPGFRSQELGFHPACAVGRPAVPSRPAWLTSAQQREATH